MTPPELLADANARFARAAKMTDAEIAESFRLSVECWDRLPFGGYALDRMPRAERLSCDRLSAAFRRYREAVQAALKARPRAYVVFVSDAQASLLLDPRGDLEIVRPKGWRTGETRRRAAV